MASHALPSSVPPQQPGLRSFIVYDRLPAGLAAYPVMDDRNAPHLRTGDFVIVDPTDHEPCAGELFLMDWKSSPGHYGVNETFETAGIKGWCVGPLSQPEMVKEAMANGAPVSRWCDFGYKTEALSDRIMGRVVGLLEPKFAEPIRGIA